jgi:C4-dicarboxylate-specific signal transduction histidine kinase
MGEMASLGGPRAESAAHCHHQLLQRHGLARRRTTRSKKTDLIAALQKTSRQAERAGQIIHRIRAFVKRSEPQRQPAQRASRSSTMRSTWPTSSCAVGNVAIHTYVAQRLPPLMVDPILIEQVVLNLLKNAAEAIDSARSCHRRAATSNCAWCRKAHSRRRRRHRVQRDRHGPRDQTRSSARLYEAFFSTKPEGLGIGLSLCRSDHRVAPRPDEGREPLQWRAVSGCRFVFTLPVEPRPNRSAPVAEPHANAAVIS